jgi:hypothetical protein
VAAREAEEDLTVPEYSIGQYVTVDDERFPGVYKIAGIGKVNMSLDPVAGGRGLRVPPFALRPASAEQVEAAEAARPAVPVSTGSVVRYRNPKAAGHLCVVIKLHQDGSVNLARLGGDNGRYWPRVPPRHVTVVPGGEIEAAYVSAGGTL